MEIITDRRLSQPETSLAKGDPGNTQRDLRILVGPDESSLSIVVTPPVDLVAGAAPAPSAPATFPIRRPPLAWASAAIAAGTLPPRVPAASLPARDPHDEDDELDAWSWRLVIILVPICAVMAAIGAGWERGAELLIALLWGVP